METEGEGNIVLHQIRSVKMWVNISQEWVSQRDSCSQSDVKQTN